jgi:hypothetical protein
VDRSSIIGSMSSLPITANMLNFGGLTYCGWTLNSQKHVTIQNPTTDVHKQ